MRTRITLITMIAVLASFLAGCGLDKQKLQDSFDAGKAGMTYEEYMAEDEEKSEEASKTISEEKTEEKESEPETDDLSEVSYSKDFKQASYKDYGSEEADGRDADLIYVRGEVVGIEDDQNLLTLAASDGEWMVDLGTGESEAFIKQKKALKGKEMRVFGTYDGWSKAFEKPVISIVKGAPEYACRMESMDEEIRITYLDSKWEDKKADADYSLGSLTWQGVSSWEIDNSLDEKGNPVTGTVSFAPLAGYEASFFVYYEKLSSDNVKVAADDPTGTLDSLTGSYLEGASILEQQKTKVAGLNAIRSRVSLPLDDEDFEMDEVIYVVLDKDCYYALSFGEPYFMGTCLSDYEKSFTDSVKYSGTADAAEDNKKEDSKKSASDEKKESSKTDDTKKNTETDTKNVAETETKKTGIPTKSEIQGKVFTQHIDMTILTADGETIPQSDDYTATFSAAELAQYDPGSGNLTYTEDGIGYTITFSYNSSGKIAYSGLISGGDNDSIFSGSTSGHEL